MHTFIKIGNTIINTAQIVSIDLSKAPEYVSINFVNGTQIYEEYAPELCAYFSGKGTALNIGNEGNMVELVKAEPEETPEPAPFVQLYVPYSSWDNARFWIGQEVFGRDFPTADEADEYGAIFPNKAQDTRAYALYNEGSGALPYEQVMWESEAV